MFDYIIALIALIWLTAAAVIDIKTKEIPNWLNFSLIAVAFSIFLFKSIQLSSFQPILSSLVGFGIVFIIGNIMYYTKQWGGGDAKLLYGLGALLPHYPQQLTNFFSPNLNLPFLAILFINIMVIGAAYALLISFILIIKRRKEFSKEFKRTTNKIKGLSKVLFTLLTIFILAIIFIQNNLTRTFLFLIVVFPILFFYLFISIKTIEKVQMYKKIKTSKLVEGDWITEKIIINKKLIYNPEKSLGITKKQIALIKKHKKEIIIKEGIAFVPSFWIATIISLVFGNILF
ncbi:A24 family peptidase [archaeon]|nr:A24 family peptidase [archaeon]